MRILSTLSAILLLIFGFYSDPTEARAIKNVPLRGYLDDHFVHYEIISKTKSIRFPRKHCQNRKDKRLRKPKEHHKLSIHYRGLDIEVELSQNNNLFTEEFDIKDHHKNKHFHGTVVGIKGSIARMTLTSENLFQGSILLGSELGTLHVEPLRSYRHHHDKEDDMMVVYHSEDLIATQKHHSHHHHRHHHHNHHKHHHHKRSAENKTEGSNFVEKFKRHLKKREQAVEVLPMRQIVESLTAGINALAASLQQQPSTDAENASPQGSDSTQQHQNVCKIALIADNSYYQTHGAETESLMYSYIQQVSANYEAQLGFSLGVAFSYVSSNPNDETGFGAVTNDATSVVQYINDATKKVPGLSADDMCMILTFSSQELTDGAVGVAFVGTVCQPGGQAFIVGDKGGRMPQAEYVSVIQHEGLHVLGSRHDEPGGECDPGEGVRYVMFPQVQKSQNMHSASPCTVKDVQKNLEKPEALCMFKLGKSRSSFIRKPVRNPELIIG